MDCRKIGLLHFLSYFDCSFPFCFVLILFPFSFSSWFACFLVGLLQYSFPWQSVPFRIFDLGGPGDDERERVNNDNQNGSSSSSTKKHKKKQTLSKQEQQRRWLSDFEREGKQFSAVIFVVSLGDHLQDSLDFWEEVVSSQYFPNAGQN